MAKSKLKEVNIDELGIEEIEEINNFPEIPLPTEPSMEEQIAMATKDLENKVNDLTQQIYYKEMEVKELRAALENQANYFDKTVSNLVQVLCAPKNN